MNDPVFASYDRAALDAQYDNRAKVPDAAEHLARFTALSRARRERGECRLDVAYGDAPGERLDVFGTGDGGAPIQLFIHGGYWKLLSKEEFSYVADAFTPAGAITVVVEYDLMPSIDMDTLVDQCRRAVAWTWKHAAEVGGDPERLFVSGHSAGGHLTAMMMATDWPAFDAALPAEPIAGACGISGLYDLEPIRLCFLNDDLGLDEAQARRASPIRLPRRCACPLMLPVGGDEGPEYLRQSRSLADAWAADGPAPQVRAMPGLDHFTIVAQLESPDSDLARAMLDQMGL